MARQEGNQRFIGRIGDLVYYKRKGVYLVRKVGSPSKKRIKEDPTFDKTRKLNCEFSAAAKAGHDFRFALSDVIQDIADSDLTGRVQGLFAKVIHHGEGECGSRSIEVLNNAEQFIDFQFNRKNSFNSVFSGHYKITTKRSRKEASIHINSFDPKIDVNHSPGATHMRFCFTLLVFSDYTIPNKGKAYKVVNPTIHCEKLTVYSDYILLLKKSSDVLLTAKLPIKAKLPESVGVIACIGVRFYKKENENMYDLIGKNCMKVVEVH
jgi:hypothetical protein